MLAEAKIWARFHYVAEVSPDNRDLPVIAPVNNIG